MARGITQSKFADGRTQSTMASPMKLVNSHQSLITPTFTSSSTHRYFQKRKKENGRHELYQRSVPPRIDESRNLSQLRTSSQDSPRDLSDDRCSEISVGPRTCCVQARYRRNTRALPFATLTVCVRSRGGTAQSACTARHQAWRLSTPPRKLTQGTCPLHASRCQTLQLPCLARE